MTLNPFARVEPILKMWALLSLHTESFYLNLSYWSFCFCICFARLLMRNDEEIWYSTYLGLRIFLTSVVLHVFCAIPYWELLPVDLFILRNQIIRQLERIHSIRDENPFFSFAKGNVGVAIKGEFGVAMGVSDFT